MSKTKNTLSGTGNSNSSILVMVFFNEKMDLTFNSTIWKALKMTNNLYKIYLLELLKNPTVMDETISISGN